MSTDAEPRLPAEAEIQALHERAEYEAAAERALSLYGRELLEFLVALHRDDFDEADEVFALFAEGFWRTWPGFAWQCSARTWMYTIARRSSLEFRRKEGRRRRRVVRLDSERLLSPQLSGLIARVRTATAPYLRTENKDRIRMLRRSLPEDEQALLMLRVDRQLTWKQLARVMRAESAGQPPVDEQALAREAARLRKRFQLVKDKLYTLARREGLIS